MHVVGVCHESSASVGWGICQPPAPKQAPSCEIEICGWTGALQPHDFEESWNRCSHGSCGLYRMLETAEEQCKKSGQRGCNWGYADASRDADDGERSETQAEPR